MKHACEQHLGHGRHLPERENEDSDEEFDNNSSGGERPERPDSARGSHRNLLLLEEAEHLADEVRALSRGIH